MKTTMQKGLSILLALLMFAALLVPVTAADEGYTLTINNTKSGHTYEAYQIFTGTYYKEESAEKGNLSNVEWGTGVVTEKTVEEKTVTLLAALQADETIGSLFTDCTDAEGVAYVLQEKIDNNSQQLDAFAEIVNGYLANDPTATSTQTGEEANYTYTISNLSDGYYLVKDANESNIANGDARTKLILKMVGDVTVTAKADAPTLEKKIVEDEPSCNSTEETHEHADACYARVDANNAAIDELVKYELTAKIPDMDGYKQYIFKMVDTLSDGLTFNKDIAVTINGVEVTANTDYSVAVDGQTITVNFLDFLQYNTPDYIGKDIVVTYTATLNENAVVGSVGNTNTANLVYSNDPQNDGSGTPDTDGDDNGDGGSTGVTPEVTVKTYTTGLKLIKFAKDGEEEIMLAGAVFEISGNALIATRTTGERFEKDETGTWYLVDGKYTQTKPAEYAGSSYSLKAIEKTKLTAESLKITAAVGSDGVLVLEGLAAGEYTITEIKAPNGYNLLEEPIAVTITWDETNGFTAKKGEESLAANEANLYELKVENKAGPVLPETGGIGTTILYIVGGILLVGAIVLLLVKVLTDRKQRSN